MWNTRSKIGCTLVAINIRPNPINGITIRNIHASFALDSVLFMTGVDHPIASAYPLATTADEGYPWISLKLFENERFFLSRSGGSLRAFTDQILESAHVSPKHIITLDKVETIMELVSRGQGVGFCADSYRSFVSVSQPLHLFSVGNEMKRIDFCAVNMKGKVLTPYAKRAIEIVKEIMDGQLY